eukprot:5966958-Pyramimonas_sp.AAC.1
MAKDVFSTVNIDSDANLLVLDSACQTIVAGLRGLRLFQERYLDRQGLQVCSQPEREQCRFGPGEPMTSTERWSMPVGVHRRAMALHTSTIDDVATARSSFLGGRDLMTDLGCVIDLAGSRVHFLAAQLPN